MKLRLRIFIYKGGKRLSKEDLKERTDNFGRGLRYITEFKYLEASKWLLLSEDSFEKYALLCLINIALGYREGAVEYMEASVNYKPQDEIYFVVDNPEKNFKKEIRCWDDLSELMDLIF